MDWQTLRREKLARAASDTRQGKEGARWRVLGERAIDLWMRFWAFSWLEKGLALGGAALVLILIPVALFALASGNGNAGDQPSGVLLRATATAPRARPTATAALVVAPSATRTTVAPSPTLEAASVRTDCGEIRGTAYASEAERLWFLANCLDLTPAAQAQATVGPSLPPASSPATPVGPAPSPTPSAALSAEEVIDLAVWAMSGDVPLGYTVSAESCSASQTANSQWTVSCQAVLPGCQSLDCRITLTVCIIEEPLTIWSC
ncbi:MAG: hypothetical protein A2148_00260 [Chloroflexi bacterium RBG_16_68_14]|nr:MAG: hypothetical protein A2148_00260 [Chloroflexi bacterium RBG_16_68_14]